MNKSSIDSTAKNLELEKMRYNNNSLSYKLGYCGIACSVIAAFIALNSFGSSDASTMVKILMNIVILLVGFLATEKVKVYKKEYSYVMCTLGGVCFARIFWVPLQLFIYYNKFINAIDPTNNNSFTAAKEKYGSKLGATIIGKWNDATFNDDGNLLTEGYRTATGYLTMNGNIRAIIILVFLALAGVSFIASGIINIHKSNKLNNYLVEIGEKH